MDKQIQQIQDTLAQNDLAQSADLLLQLRNRLPNRYRNEVVSHVASIRQLATDERQGLLTSDELRRERRRIIMSVQDLLDDVAQHVQPSSFVDHEVREYTDTSSKDTNTTPLAQSIEFKKRRLRILEEQRAMKGYDIEPHVRIEIEDLRREIADLERH